MYRGNNKTAITSQEMMAEACYRLLEQKPLADIRVSELCQAAKVSRQTFYSLFQNKENVIIYLLISHYPVEIKEYMEAQHTDAMTLENICHCFSIYMDAALPLVKLIIKSGLSRLLAIAFYRGIIRSPRKFIVCADTYYREYVAYFLAGGLASITERYAREHDAVDKKELERMTAGLFRGEFFPQAESSQKL
jgi:AcrR family transcriptional regulator